MGRDSVNRLSGVALKLRLSKSGQGVSPAPFRRRGQTYGVSLISSFFQNVDCFGKSER